MASDITDFQAQVIDRSFTIPILVDFWAEWCSPCRVLGPVLERLAASANGRWELAKVNTEVHPETAAQYGVRSIPNVKLFVDGKVVDEFVGALSEVQIEQWLTRAIPSKLRLLVDQAEALMVSEVKEQARALLTQVLEQEPNNDKANSLLARLIMLEDPSQAAALADRIAGIEYGEIVDAFRIIAHLSEYARSTHTEPLAADHGLYLEGIERLFTGKYAAALEKFIEAIKRNRKLDDDGARKACVAIFKILGEDHPITLGYRREFANALY